MASANALAGLGGLNVQSNLGEPFSGSIVVTGKEAEALLNNQTVVVSGGGISGSVVPQKNGNVVIHLRSGGAVNEPILNFFVKAGNQTRQYTAMINPARYRPDGTLNYRHENKKNKVVTRSNRQIVGELDDMSQPQTEIKVERKNFTPMKRHSNAQYHRVQTGETLAQVAARYRPHNMSQQRAMRAIMAANPRAFRRGTSGDIMYDGATLYIPTVSQFQDYAKSGKRLTQRRFARHRYQAPAAASVSSVTENATNQAMQADNSTIQTQPQTTAVMPSAPATNVVKEQIASPVVAPIASEPVINKEASVPASFAVAPVVSSEVAASTTSDSVASAVVASELALASMVASMPASSPVSTPITTVQEPAAPVNTEIEEETNWTELALMGLAGAAALGGVGYLLSRRKNNNEEQVEDADELVIEETVVTSPAVAAAQRVNLNKQQTAPVLNDEDDNLFGEFEEPIAGNAKVNNEFSLDNFEPQTDEADDFDWLKEVEATPAPNDWQSDTTKTVAAQNIASHAISEPNNVPEFDANNFEVDNTPVISENSNDDDWLSEVFVEETKEEVNEVNFEHSGFDDQVDEIKFNDFNDLDIAETKSVAVEASTVAEENTDDAFEFEIADPASTTQLDKIEDDLSFDLPETVEPSETNFELDEMVKTDSDGFDLNLPENESTEFNLNLPEEENNLTDFDLSLPDDNTDEVAIADELAFEEDAHLVADSNVDFAENPDLKLSQDLPVSESVVEIDALDTNMADISEQVSAEEMDSLNSLNDLDIDFDEPASTETNLSFADEASSFDEAPISITSKEEMSWMDDADSVTQQDAGFVSETVGMTAPQEAKMELAKMYLEIDDAVAARETLRELIAESNGTLQQQAKDLLNELGG